MYPSLTSISEGLAHYNNIPGDHYPNEACELCLKKHSECHSKTLLKNFSQQTTFYAVWIWREFKVLQVPNWTAFILMSLVLLKCHREFPVFTKRRAHMILAIQDILVLISRTNHRNISIANVLPIPEVDTKPSLLDISVLMVNYGISNTIVLEIP